MSLYNAGFDATWELDFFGRVRRAIQADTAEVAATVATRQDVLVTLISEVARNYFELRGAQNQLAVARGNVENQRETLDIALAKFKAGRATELDTARARAQLDATLALIPPLEAAVKHAIHRLSVLTGQQPTALESELAPPAPIPALPPLVNIGNPAELLRRRPDIRSAESSLAAATARIGVETADLFPRVTFNGNLGVQASEFSGLVKGGADTYSFGPSITWAALDLGHVLARIKAANARADAQLAAYEKTVLNALEETENALVDFGHEQVRRDYLRTSERSATQAMTLARQRYDGGIADFLPVLDAQRSATRRSRPNWPTAKPAPPPASSPSTKPWAAAGKLKTRQPKPPRGKEHRGFYRLTARKTEGRKPRPERRPKSEIRIRRSRAVGLRASDFLRVSAFGFRFSSLLQVRMPMPQDVRPFQTVRQHQFLVVQQLGHWAFGDHRSAIEHDGPRTQLDDQFQVVRRNQLGRGYLPQQRLELAPPARVEVAGRLVQHQHGWARRPARPARQARRFSPWLR